MSSNLEGLGKHVERFRSRQTTLPSFRIEFGVKKMVCQKYDGLSGDFSDKSLEFRLPHGPVGRTSYFQDIIDPCLGNWDSTCHWVPSSEEKVLNSRMGSKMREK